MGGVGALLRQAGRCVWVCVGGWGGGGGRGGGRGARASAAVAGALHSADTPPALLLVGQSCLVRSLLTCSLLTTLRCRHWPPNPAPSSALGAPPLPSHLAPGVLAHACLLPGGHQVGLVAVARVDNLNVHQTGAQPQHLQIVPRHCRQAGRSGRAAARARRGGSARRHKPHAQHSGGAAARRSAAHP